MRAILFDLDGTLADTSGDLIRAANLCLDRFGGARLDALQDRTLAYRGGRAMLAHGLRDTGFGTTAQIEALYPEFLALYRRDICRTTRLFDGVVPALDALVAAGFGLGVCTNKPEALARRVLHALGILAPFGVLVGGDSYPVRKPHPRPLEEAAQALGAMPSDCLLVGDTETDLCTARAAGSKVALVTFGAEGEAVRAMAPDAVLERFASLPGIARRLLAETA